jgi:hypothetical protein
MMFTAPSKSMVWPVAVPSAPVSESRTMSPSLIADFFCVAKFGATDRDSFESGDPVFYETPQLNAGG